MVGCVQLSLMQDPLTQQLLPQQTVDVHPQFRLRSGIPQPGSQSEVRQALSK